MSRIALCELILLLTLVHTLALIINNDVMGLMLTVYVSQSINNISTSAPTLNGRIGSDCCGTDV